MLKQPLSFSELVKNNLDLALAFTPFLSHIDILRLSRVSTADHSIFYSDQTWYRKILQDFGITIAVQIKYLRRVNNLNKGTGNKEEKVEESAVKMTPLHLYKLLKAKVGLEYRNTLYNVYALNESEQKLFLSCCFDDSEYFSKHVPYENIDWWFDWSLVLGCTKIPEKLFKDKRIVVKEINLRTVARQNCELAKLFIKDKEIPPHVMFKLVGDASAEFVEHLKLEHAVVLTDEHFSLALRRDDGSSNEIGKILYHSDNFDDQIKNYISNIENAGTPKYFLVRMQMLISAIIGGQDITKLKTCVRILKSKIEDFAQQFLSKMALRSATSYDVCEYLVNECGVKPRNKDMTLALQRGCLKTFRFYTAKVAYKLPDQFPNDQYFGVRWLPDNVWDEVLSHCHYEPDIKVINVLLSKNNISLAKKYITQYKIIPNAQSVIAVAKTGIIENVIWLLDLKKDGKNIIELSVEEQGKAIKSAIYSRNQRLIEILVTRFEFKPTEEFFIIAIFSNNPQLARYFGELIPRNPRDSLKIDKYIAFSQAGLHECSFTDTWIDGWASNRFLFNPFNNVEWNEALVFHQDYPAYRLIIQFAQSIKQTPNEKNKIGFNSLEFSNEFPYSFDCPMLCYDWIDYLFVHHDRMEINDLTILLNKDWIQETPSPIGRHYLAQFAECGLVDLPKEKIDELKKSSEEMLEYNPKLKEFIFPANNDEQHKQLRRI